jgi:thiol-disulfide isomerase/thioredoxin/5-hydroxyisourate hydrolase-like protein (transthyretin family)
MTSTIRVLKWLMLTTIFAAGCLMAARARAATAGAAAATTGPASVSGVVTTPDGKPIIGARVAWVVRGDREPREQASVTTDASGHFRFPDAAPPGPNSRPQLMVEAAGWGLTFQDVPEGDAPLTLTLRPATELRAAFTDASGRPATGVRVIPRFLFGQGIPFFDPPPALRDRLARRTDAQGRIAMAGLPQALQMRLDVDDERFAHLNHADTIVTLGQTAITALPKPIRLQPAASVTGRVTFGSTGKPAAGVRVGAQGVGAGEGWSDAVTDADGRYRLTQLDTGAYNVALDLSSELAKSWTAQAHEKLYVATGDQLKGIDFTLIQGAIITGKVTAVDNEQPVAGAFVSVYGPAHPRSGAWVQGVQTGPDGTYFHRVPPGAQYLYMGGVPPNFVRPAQEGHELTLKDGETLTVDFKLLRGAPLKPVRVRALGPDVKPVAGAEVVITSIEHGVPFGNIRRTNAQGVLVLGEREVYGPITLRARHGSMGTRKGFIAQGGDEVTLRLEPNTLAALSGRVTNAAGQPLVGARVTLYEWTYDSGTESAKTITDAQGRFSFSSLFTDSRYSVRATTSGYGEPFSPTVELRPGESVKLDALALSKADRTLAGRVVDGKGDPVVGVELYLEGRETPFRHTATDREGHFRFEGVVDEELKVNAHPSEDRWVSKKVRAGNSDVILVVVDEKQAAQEEPQPQKEDFEALRGKAAPPLQPVAWLNTKPLSPVALRGKVVLVDFWAIGCGPCVAALLGVQRTAEQLQPKGAVVIGLHSAGITPKQLKEFAEGKKLTYPLAIDAEDPQGPSFGKTFRQFGIIGIPSVAVIDREGNVAYLGNFLAEGVSRAAALVAQPERTAATP